MTQVWCEGQHVGTMRDTPAVERRLAGLYLKPQQRQLRLTIDIWQYQEHPETIGMMMEESGAPNDCTWQQMRDLYRDALVYIGAWWVFDVTLAECEILFDHPNYDPV